MQEKELQALHSNINNRGVEVDQVDGKHIRSTAGSPGEI
jgi:hypothetical protein